MFMVVVWNILLTSEPVGSPVASVLGMASWDILVWAGRAAGGRRFDRSLSLLCS